MASNPTFLHGDFSMSKLLHEAAANWAETPRPIETIQCIDRPSMSGTIVAAEVQPGLRMSAFDIAYLEDSCLNLKIERLASCAVLLQAHKSSVLIDRRRAVVQEPGRAVLLGFGEPHEFNSSCRAGQRVRAFCFTLKPSFFERHGDLIDGDELDALQGYLRGGFRCTTLPWSATLIDLAERGLNHPYSGQLRVLFQESHTLRVMLEVAVLLRDKERLVRTLGRRQFELASRAREILDGALLEPPSSLELARQVGINVSTLQTCFKAAFGTTLFGYVRTRRLEMARILIFEHGLRVSEAAYRVGFSNAAAFTASYRRHFGQAPTVERSR